MQQQVRPLSGCTNGGVGKSFPFEREVLASNPRAPPPKAQNPNPDTPHRRTAAPPSRLTDGRTFFAAPQMNASTFAGAAIEVTAEDMEEVNSAVSMVELAIIQEGKGGFDMRPEDRRKDFYDTLASYLASAMKGLPVVEHTMGEVTIHGQKEYTVHYPIVMVTPETRAALLGPKPHALHELRYAVHRTTPLGSDKTERTCKVYVCDAANIWELPGLRRASIDPKLPPGTPPPGVVAKCWVNNPRRCRIAARPFRNSAGMELYADLCATIDTLNGNGKFGAQAIGDGPSPITLHPIKSYIPTFLHVGEPVPTSGPMGISGYCITMWIISTDAPAETAADPAHFGGLLLPSTLLHPSVIALVDKEGGGGKVTQPLYTAPCADLRAKRIVHDGTAVRWTLPTLTGVCWCC